MKTPYISLQIISVLAFGMISCSSDKTSEISEPPVTTKAEIQNTDETIQKIIGTSQVRASANISLEIDKGSFTTGNILASVECKTNFSKEVLTKDTVLEPTTNIYVKNILPSKVFSPNKEDNPSVKCDMRLDINNEQDPTVIKLVGVKVLGTKEFSNINFDFIPEETETQLRETLSRQNFNAPLNQGEIETLCEDSNSFNFINESAQTVEDFISESLFEDKNVINCRLLFRDDKTSETWITKPFKIQNKQAAIHVETNRNWPGSRTFEFYESTPVVFKVSNPTELPAKLKIKIPESWVTVSPVYKRVTKSNFWVHDKIKLDARWEMENFSAPMEKDSTSGAYILKPGHSFEFHLVVNGNVNCGIGNLGPNPKHNPNCIGNPIHAGNEFLIKSFPQMHLNVREGNHSDSWKDVSIYEKQTKLTDRYIGHWAKNLESQKICNWKAVSHPKVSFIQMKTTVYNQCY